MSDKAWLLISLYLACHLSVTLTVAGCLLFCSLLISVFTAFEGMSAENHIWFTAASADTQWNIKANSVVYTTHVCVPSGFQMECTQQRQFFDGCEPGGGEGCGVWCWADRGPGISNTGWDRELSSQGGLWGFATLHPTPLLLSPLGTYVQSQVEMSRMNCCFSPQLSHLGSMMQILMLGGTFSVTGVWKKHFILYSRLSDEILT